MSYRFRRGDRVLFRMDDYFPATIVTVGYQITENDGDEDDWVVGDVVPYQARLLGGHNGLVFVPTDDNDRCCILDSDNLVLCPVAENTLDKFLWPLIRKCPDEAN